MKEKLNLDGEAPKKEEEGMWAAEEELKIDPKDMKKTKDIVFNELLIGTLNSKESLD